MQIKRSIAEPPGGWPPINTPEYSAEFEIGAEVGSRALEVITEQHPGSASEKGSVAREENHSELRILSLRF